MSTGGPCLWVSSLSSQIPSPLSAVPSHLAAVSRHAERVSATPRRILSMPQLPRQGNHLTHINNPMAEMQRPLVADNALPNPMPGLERSAEMGSYRDGVSASRQLAEKPPAEMREMRLPQIKLNTRDDGYADQAASMHPAGTDRPVDAVHAAQMDLDKHGDNDHDSPSSPVDDKGEEVEENDDNQSSIIDKKKMKRFRLTHNQTRFLMSEFTRQAHPDAAHRERLSREIPGLTPRQVQVWFQNRRAKLKRLTTNDRERMLKSRALPDDFDTTKVLRTPFESKSIIPNPMGTPHDFGAPNPDFASLRALRTDCFPRPNEDEYMTSPLSSASTAGTYMSSAGRSDGLPSSGMMFGRPTASASMSDLHRSIRNDYSITRSSSLSDGTSHPASFQPTLHMQNRYASTTHSGLPYMRQPVMDFTFPRHSGSMIPPFEQQQPQQPFEGSVSPTNSNGQPIGYDMNNINAHPKTYQPQQQYPMSAPKPYGAHTTGSQIPPQGLTMSAVHSLPASTQDFRPYSYATTSAPLSNMPYATANTSAISLPASFGSTDANAASQDVVPQQSQGVDSLRDKFGSQSYTSYSNYLQQ
ncbi:Homeobox transcription factor [Penicillium ucsense]|uniref:Homeobox transcription factor n=1 Tax=Penicillium ucsense TaxID=2839758 RepID=A0A8J8WLT3_9EURO|nr:Homeobox transcription factor [Penicillium ucsense]KAF7739136.1 Homeobox transcription factor [Penicillium ucsense]